MALSESEESHPPQHITACFTLYPTTHGTRIKDEHLRPRGSAFGFSLTTTYIHHHGARVFAAGPPLGFQQYFQGESGDTC